MATSHPSGWHPAGTDDAVELHQLVMQTPREHTYLFLVHNILVYCLLENSCRYALLLSQPLSATQVLYQFANGALLTALEALLCGLGSTCSYFCTLCCFP